MSPISVVAMKQQHARRLIATVDKPGPQLLPIARLDALWLDAPHPTSGSASGTRGSSRRVSRYATADETSSQLTGMTARKISHRLSRGRSLSRNVPKDIKSVLKRLTSSLLTVILVLTITLIPVLLNARIGPVAKCIRGRGAMDVVDRPWPAWVAAAAAILVSGFAIEAQVPPLRCPSTPPQSTLPPPARTSTSKRSPSAPIPWVRQSRSACVKH